MQLVQLEEKSVPLQFSTSNENPQNIEFWESLQFSVPADRGIQGISLHGPGWSGCIHCCHCVKTFKLFD